MFALPMAHALDGSLPVLNGPLSVELMVSGLCAYPVGAYIDRHGGRGVMTAGSLAAAALLIAWSQVTTLAAFYGVWIGLGACMAAVLYEPAFVVLTALFGAQSRRAITALTLIADGAARALLRQRLRCPLFWGMAVWFAAFAGTASGLTFQRVPYLQTRGVDRDTLLTTIALIGPSQVSGRVLLPGRGERANLVATGAITTPLTRSRYCC